MLGVDTSAASFFFLRNSMFRVLNNGCEGTQRIQLSSLTMLCASALLVLMAIFILVMSMKT